MYLFHFNIFRSLFFMCYAVIVLLFFFYFASPYLVTGDLFAPRMLADSITFLDLCLVVQQSEDLYWLRDAGPCASVYLFGKNLGLMALSNFLVLTIAAHYFARNYSLVMGKVLILLLVNPITFLSLFGPNKEIFGVACSMFLLSYLKKRSLSLFLLTLGFAFLTRYFMLVTVSVFFLIDFLVMNVTRRKFVVLLCLFFLIMVSAFAAVQGRSLQLELLGNVFEAETNSMSTVISMKLEMFTQAGLFIITYIARVIINFYGAIANIFSMSLSSHGVYYTIGVIGSSVIFLVMTLLIIFRHRGNLLRAVSSAPSIWLFFVVFSALACTSPVIQHRYFYPLYPCFILFVLVRRRKISGTGNILLQRQKKIHNEVVEPLGY